MSYAIRNILLIMLLGFSGCMWGMKKKKPLPCIIVSDGKKTVYYLVNINNLTIDSQLDPNNILESIQIEAPSAGDFPKLSFSGGTSIPGVWTNRAPRDLKSSSYTKTSNVAGTYYTLTLANLPQELKPFDNQKELTNITALLQEKPASNAVEIGNKPATQNPYQSLWDRILHGKKVVAAVGPWVTIGNQYYTIEKDVFEWYKKDKISQWLYSSKQNKQFFAKKNDNNLITIKRAIESADSAKIEEEIKTNFLSTNPTVKEISFQHYSLRVHDKDENEKVIEGTFHTITGYKKTYWERYAALGTAAIATIGIAAMIIPRLLGEPTKTK